MPADEPMETGGDDANRPGIVRLFGGLTIAPLAWSLQVLIGYGLAAHACYPTDTALAQPVWPHLRTFLGAASVCLWVVLVAGCAIAWVNWKATGSQSDAHPHGILQSGDGRARFMALCGVVISGLFALASLFTTVGILWVPACGP